MIPNNQIIVSSTEPTGNNRKKVWMQKGRNLFNKDDAIIDGYYINNSGNLISASNAWYQNAFIKVKSNTQYTISSGHGIFRVCLYDNNKNYISRVTTENTSLTFMTPSNCEYVKLSGDTSSIQIFDLQLEQGPSKTYYEAYIEPKIYIKNSNDVYEEFIKKEDGKIIKTLESTTPISDGEFLSGLNGITKILGFQIYNYEQWREGYLCGTLVTNKEGTSLYFLTTPDTTSYYGKPIRIFYID